MTSESTLAALDRLDRLLRLAQLGSQLGQLGVHLGGPGSGPPDVQCPAAAVPAIGWLTMALLGASRVVRHRCQPGEDRVRVGAAPGSDRSPTMRRSRPGRRADQRRQHHDLVTHDQRPGCWCTSMISSSE